MKHSLLLLLMVSLLLAPDAGLAEGDSHVIGRLTGTFQPVPGYFHNNLYLLAQGIVDVEFTGFRITNANDGRTYFIRPNSRGYFYQRLSGGEYTLRRKRTDRPSYKEPKSIDILSFSAKPGTIVNLGTIEIVLNGKPKESLRYGQLSYKGIYTYRYGYERVAGDTAYEKPLQWFRRKAPSVVDESGDRIEPEKGTPTNERDGSKVVLRLRVPREDR